MVSMRSWRMPQMRKEVMRPAEQKLRERSTSALLRSPGGSHSEGDSPDANIS